MATGYCTDSECYDDQQTSSYVKKDHGLSIICQPNDVATKVGTFIELSTIVNSPKPSFQWYDGTGKPIQHKTQKNLFIGPVREEDFGFYKLEIIDTTIKEKKYTRWVEVKKLVQVQTYDSPKPRVAVHPQGGKFRRGETVRLYGSFENAECYQWYKDGRIIEGCTGNNLIINESTYSCSGSYALMAWNPLGMERTQEVKVIIQ